MFNSELFKNKLLIDNNFLKNYLLSRFDKTVISVDQYKISLKSKYISTTVKYWDNGEITETFFNLDYKEVYFEFIKYNRKKKTNKIRKLIKKI